MNWRLSALDDISLVSNSDSHSPWPTRLGRELNVFEADMNYKEIINAIKEKNPKKFLLLSKLILLMVNTTGMVIEFIMFF